MEFGVSLLADAHTMSDLAGLTIGFIGLGLMGRPMAANLLRAAQSTILARFFLGGGGCIVGFCCSEKYACIFSFLVCPPYFWRIYHSKLQVGSANVDSPIFTVVGEAGSQRRPPNQRDPRFSRPGKANIQRWWLPTSFPTHPPRSLGGGGKGRGYAPPDVGFYNNSIPNFESNIDFEQNRLNI